MAASETVVGNAALIKLGVATVVSFSDESKQARLLAQRFEALRDLEMRMHPWTAFTTRASLTAEATAPAFGYDSAYVLPADCLRLTRVGDYDAVPGLTRGGPSQIDITPAQGIEGGGVAEAVGGAEGGGATIFALAFDRHCDGDTFRHGGGIGHFSGVGVRQPRQA